MRSWFGSRRATLTQGRASTAQGECRALLVLVGAGGLFRSLREQKPNVYAGFLAYKNDAAAF
jgi:hypothetical protein